MIDLRLNGKSLNLSPDINISIESTSPLFSEEEEGMLSYPFDIPFSNDNCKILGFPESILRRETPSKAYDNFEVYLNKSRWKKGVLRIRSIKNNLYTANFNAESSYFNSQVVNKKLKDLLYGGERVIRKYVYSKVRLSGSGTTGNVQITVTVGGGPIFSKTVPFNTSIEQTLEDLAAAFMADVAGRALHNVGVVSSYKDIITFFSPSDTDPITGVPPTYAPGFSPAGSGRSWNSVSDNYYTRVFTEHMLKAALASYPDYDYAFFPVKNPGFYADNNAEYKNYVNYFNGSEFGTLIASDFDSQELFDTTITPFPYLAYILKAIYQEHGIRLTGSFVDDEEIKKVVVYNNYAIDKLFMVGIPATAQANRFTDSINLNKHVPDISIGEFIKAVKATFNLAYFYNNEKGTVDVKTKKSILKDPNYEDWTNIAEPFTEQEFEDVLDLPSLITKKEDNDEAVKDRIKDLSGYTIKDPVDNVADLPATADEKEIRLVRNLNYYYLVVKSYDSGSLSYVYTWTKFSENLDDYKPGDDKEKIDMLSSTLTTEIIDDVEVFDPTYDLEWVVPYADQKGSSIEYEIGINPCSLRFLIYQGFQPGRLKDGTDMIYPLGTPYNKNFNNDEIGTLSLAPDKLYEDFHSDWIEFKRNTRLVKINLRLDAEMIRNIDYSLKKRINNVTYLLSKITGTVTMDGPKIFTGYFYKV